ncbi:hypothetical protein BDP27DRAFT_1319558 [Rhodocollybia butyracea]|uniref:Uncharacterized protein n=1 Tax=Rhodocollybia butyracea TaxID=206335 RepID=A0A9P5Q105_9AGAR|nr:hypothetical protein BDP27DRAFT_1319558 [Rhodocollybia butyracea]
MFEPLTRFPNIQYLGVRHDNESKYRSADVILRVVPITSLKVEFHPEVTRPLGPYQPDLLEVAMDSLIAPSLTELVIQVDDHTHENAANSRISLPRTFLCVSHFIVRSCCTLSVLVLQGLPVSDKLVVDLLKDLRGLTDLTIEDPDRMMLQQQSYPISEDLIESLHVCRPNYLNPSPNPLVPNLRSLVLKVISQEPFNAVTFNLTIASRWIPDKEYETQSNVSCLRSVELHLPDKVDRTLYFLLISLERCGMRIVVKEESYT